MIKNSGVDNQLVAFVFKKKNVAIHVVLLFFYYMI
jgi:hypothetical protein